jgi:hypothetical protein
MKKIKYTTWSKSEVDQIKKINLTDQASIVDYANDNGRTVKSVYSKIWRLNKKGNVRPPKKTGKTSLRESTSGWTKSISTKDISSKNCITIDAFKSIEIAGNTVKIYI